MVDGIVAHVSLDAIPRFMDAAMGRLMISGWNLSELRRHSPINGRQHPNRFERPDL